MLLVLFSVHSCLMTGTYGSHSILLIILLNNLFEYCLNKYRCISAYASKAILSSKRWSEINHRIGRKTSYVVPRSRIGKTCSRIWFAGYVGPKTYVL